MGDKGYISKEIETKLKNIKNIDLLTYKRTNMKKQNTLQENEKLKKRIKIEHFFGINKNKFKFLKLRNQKKYIYFHSMIMFGFSLFIINKIQIKNNFKKFVSI